MTARAMRERGERWVETHVPEATVRVLMTGLFVLSCAAAIVQAICLLR